MTADRYTHPIKVRFRDLDTREHVNHAVYVTYLEQAKVRFFAERVGIDLDALTTVVRALDVDYRRPIALGEDVAVALGFTELGTTSYTIEYEITADGETAASARTVSVLLGDDGEPDPIPEAWRESIERHRVE